MARQSKSQGAIVRGKASLAESVARFIPLYLGECKRNSTATAIAMGASPRSAYAIGGRYLAEARKSGALAVAAQALAQAVELKTEDILREVKRIACSDPRRYYRDDGSVKAPDEWDDDMAAAVESIQTIPVMLGNKIAYVYKLKFWSKNQALDMAMRHAGLFERDNRQRRDNLAIQINLVGAPPEAMRTVGNRTAAPTNGANGKNGSHP